MKKELKKDAKLALVEGLVVKIQKNEANKLRGGYDSSTESDSVNTKFTEIATCCGSTKPTKPTQNLF